MSTWQNDVDVSADHSLCLSESPATDSGPSEAALPSSESIPAGPHPASTTPHAPGAEASPESRVSKDPSMQTDRYRRVPKVIELDELLTMVSPHAVG